MFENLLLGISTALSVHNLLYAFVGVLLGNIIGVLPGIGAMAALAMLLPVTYGLDPIGSMLMLAGLYYGTSFGGATTAILLNLPGTSEHAVVCLDGHPLAKQGRAGPAIFIAMFASFVGVSAGIVLVMFFSPLLSDMAFLFGPTEYFSLLLMGLLAASSVSTSSPLKGIAAVFLGCFLGTVGSDANTGVERFTFGIAELAEGLSIVALAMGLFGLTDVLNNVGTLREGSVISGAKVDRKSIRPSADDMKRSVGPMARGSALGSLIGVLPGAGSTLAAFLSYIVEKRVSRTPERFGSGAIEGVAGPESSNSSSSITSFIPTLTLGIPGDAVMALMLGALMIHDITPGPQLITQHPELFWGLVVSFWIGNFMLMVMNIPFIGIWVKLLSVKYRFIYPVILFLIAIGVYSGSNTLFEVGEVMAIGVAGAIFAYYGFQPAPIIIGVILGPMLEENFRRAMLLSRGDVSVFVTKPISAVFIGAIVLFLTFVVLREVRRRTRAAERQQWMTQLGKTEDAAPDE